MDDLCTKKNNQSKGRALGSVKEVSFQLSQSVSLVSLSSLRLFASSAHFDQFQRLEFKRSRVIILAVFHMQLKVSLSGPLGTKRCEYIECATTVSAPRFQK